MNDTTTAEAETKEPKSIIGAKYGKGYKGAQDWLAATIDENVKDAVTKEVVTTAEDGTKSTETVETKATAVNLDKLFKMAELNGLAVEKYKADVDKKNAPGRLRMTIGNMLRAVAKKRHGLYIASDGGSEWIDAPAEFLGDAPKTHERNGTKIVVAKPAAEAASPAAETAEAEAEA